MHSQCAHHWLIESAETATAAGHSGYSYGKCQECHEVRDNFQNYVPSGTWQRQITRAPAEEEYD